MTQQSNHWSNDQMNKQPSAIVFCRCNNSVKFLDGRVWASFCILQCLEMTPCQKWNSQRWESSTNLLFVKCQRQFSTKLIRKILKESIPAHCIEMIWKDTISRLTANFISKIFNLTATTGTKQVLEWRWWKYFHGHGIWEIQNWRRFFPLKIGIKPGSRISWFRPVSSFF